MRPKKASRRSPSPPPKDLFEGGGEMGALMRSTDWSKTKLGPVEEWPKSLRTMLGVILGSRFPMLLWWGPDLLHLYNDAYRPILRDKHPASLGAPAAEVWAEVWDVAGPMARSVQEGGPATWTEDLQLFINSGSMAEETYFTFSYSPVPGDDGRFGGLLNTVQESTAKVQGERQIRMLHDLAARAAESKSEDEAYRIVAEILSVNELDLPFALLYVLNQTADGAHLVAASGLKEYEGPAKPTHVPVVEAGIASSWPFAEVIRTAREVVVEDLSSRFGALPAGRWNAPPERAIVLPLSRAGQWAPNAFLVAGLSPHRAFDDRYRRFFRVTADQVANVIANARAYEAENKRAETLAKLDRAKTAFFNNVSHEFRTPLTLILSPVEDALAQPRKVLEGENLAAVHRSALRLLRLVNSLLEFTRIEANQLETSFVAADLSAFTAELASSFRSLLEGAGIRFTVDCPPLPEPVFVDATQWEKIVLNLLSNAFKFTLQGEITIQLRHCQDHVELTVRDTGCGIPAPELPRMFERFHRIEGALGRSFEGTGIGLSLVQELVKLHGGTVQVSSVEGAGSAFVVSLPTGSSHLPPERVVERSGPDATSASSSAPYVLEASGWTAHAGAENAPQLLLGGEAGPVVGERMATDHSARILVADDNADMRGYLTRTLGAHWTVEVTNDGVAALQAAKARLPDLILSDVMMPGLDGYGLLRALREDSRTRMIPFLLLSARAGEEAVIEGLETGADDYLVKPFSARELLARVHTHLKMSQIRRAATETARELAETRATLLADVERKNQELEAFSYSVSHDLRAPVRHIDGFADLLKRNAGATLDERGQRYLRQISESARSMGQLIDDLLAFSRMGRQEMREADVDLDAMICDLRNDHAGEVGTRDIHWQIAPLGMARGDPAMLRQVFTNLISNAIKYTSKRPHAVIELGVEQTDVETIVFVRDNGVGFDMAYQHKLFGVFQRLHSAEEFEGTGIGLANVRQIIERHRGRVWAEGELDRGATFFVALPRDGAVRDSYRDAA